MMPAMIPSSAMPAQISTSVPKLVVLAELAPSANAAAQHSAEMTAAKQPMKAEPELNSFICIITLNRHIIHSKFNKHFKQHTDSKFISADAPCRMRRGYFYVIVRQEIGVDRKYARVLYIYLIC